MQICWACWKIIRSILIREERGIREQGRFYVVIRCFAVFIKATKIVLIPKILPLPGVLISWLEIGENTKITGNGQDFPMQTPQSIGRCPGTGIMFFQDGMDYYPGWQIGNGQNPAEKILITKYQAYAA